MISKKITIILLLLLLLFSINIKDFYGRGILKIYIATADEDLYKIIYNSFNKKFRIVKKPKESDILICGTLDKIKKCLSFGKPIIAINIYSFEINKLNKLINTKNIIAYFPIDLRLKDIVKFLKNNLRKNYKKCILTFYEQFKDDTECLVKKFKVHNIGEVPFVLNKAFKECDVIIGIPDDIVYNHFSIRYILKNAILNGKIFIGFTKEMADYGALYSFEIDKKKYIKKLENFLKHLNFKKKQKVFYPELKLFNIYKNSELWNDLK